MDQLTTTAAPVAEMFTALAAMPASERLTVLNHIEPAVKTVMRSTATELRAGGATWAEIGDLLGVTRQTAQIRFGRQRDQ